MNTGMGYHFLLQGIFLTQGSNPSLLHLVHWWAESLLLMPPGVIFAINIFMTYGSSRVKRLTFLRHSCLVFLYGFQFHWQRDFLMPKVPKRSHSWLVLIWSKVFTLNLEFLWMSGEREGCELSRIPR